MDRKANQRNTMTDTLFDIPESPSPRLQWLREHQIEIIDGGVCFEPGEECEITGNRLHRFWAMVMNKGQGHEAGGDTEDEAIVNLARKLNLKLWNEA
jgi:hypothetical protein